MKNSTSTPRIVTVGREIAARAEQIFDLIAEPSQQPLWDRNINLAEAREGQRIRDVGDVFTMTLTLGSIRENHVVEFEEGRRIAWLPSDPGQQPPGRLWRWEVAALDQAHSQVTHTFDWSQLTDEKRRARPGNNC